jgi:cytochrome b561
MLCPPSSAGVRHERTRRGFFIFWRLVWKLVRPVPMLPELPAWQTKLASFTHVGIYVLIFAMCILGWAAANYRGWIIWLFGLVPLPDLAAKNTPWAHTAGDIHDWLLYVLAAVLLFHIGAGRRVRFPGAPMRMATQQES